MKKLISFSQATNTSLFLVGLLVPFHLAIIIGMVFFDFTPLDFLWGGRMKTAEELLVFEIISLVTAFVILFLILVKAKKLNFPKLAGIANVGMWVLFVIFLLNTVGNIIAKTTFEKCFAVVTFILAVLMLRMALERNTN